MTPLARSALAVGVEPALFAELAAVLAPAHVVAELVGDEEEALELLSILPYDVIIAGHPLPGMRMETFLTAVRKDTCASRRAGLLIVTDEAALAEATEHVGRGANRVLASHAPATAIKQAVSSVLGAAPRISLRALTRIRVGVDREGTVTLCQTENVSVTGMLIRIDLTLPVGTEISFELSLPGDGKPVRGSARVIRQALKGHERITGIGLVFTHLEPGDGERLAALVARLAG